MVLHFYFHYKPFPGLRRAKREREWKREKVEITSLTPLSHGTLHPLSHALLSDRTTNRSTHPMSDPLLDRPTTFRSTHLVQWRVKPMNRSLSVPLSQLVLWFWFFCFDFCFLCCLYILILCNNICLDPKKMWETW